MINTFMGMRVVVSPHATKQVYHWPVKKRSRRLIKKMTKRLGPQVTVEPCFYVMPGPRGHMVVHLSIYNELLNSHTKGGDK